MTLMIKLSFIVPLYNSAKWLEKCLYSILNQDIPEDLEREQKRRYGRETARDLHRIFRIVLIAAAVIGLLIAAEVIKDLTREGI